MPAMSIRPATIPLLIAVLLSANSAAQNTRFLKDAAISNFDEQDVALMMQNVDAALNDTLVPVSHEWKNTESGNAGKAEVTSAFTNAEGTSCKRARLSNFARNGIKGATTYTFCKFEHKWMIMPGDKN